MSKIKDISVIDLNNIRIKEIEEEGFIIDITKIGDSKTVTTWKVDLLYNTFQVVLTFYRLEDKDGYQYKFETSFSEAVLTEKDTNDILNFLINNIQ